MVLGVRTVETFNRITTSPLGLTRVSQTKFNEWAIVWNNTKFLGHEVRAVRNCVSGGGGGNVAAWCQAVQPTITSPHAAFIILLHLCASVWGCGGEAGRHAGYSRKEATDPVDPGKRGIDRERWKALSSIQDQVSYARVCGHDFVKLVGEGVVRRVVIAVSTEGRAAQQSFQQESERKPPSLLPIAPVGTLEEYGKRYQASNH
ncbi:hypothetical protein E2C01_031372 [Portunus trituberculatus]|uniref:Uncharacterized protein n=1 Tax=Portunus trituberculatus TaxID=210409 RepID=A0A5B7EXI0_PORTR|nr:hypothetical protein [Portunus trituberculatus]